jgi:hypothetical protein
MLSRVSSFDDLATWEDSVSHAIPVIVVDPLEDSEDPIDPASVYVPVPLPSSRNLNWPS